MPKKNEIKARFLSPLSYPGGKSKVATKIVAAFPKVKIYDYLEPFVGGGSIFLQVIVSNISFNYEEKTHCYTCYQHTSKYGKDFNPYDKNWF